ncbi:MAG: hypothetical protein HYX42_14780 [Polaromonas sp.]|uniref:hypothetical protein n=1 Tax=Polaromonas sp. TaxID=1869339 RepID=UPI0025FFA447|nr:hypothetical protein [Polaromonas sp.]MBI2727506.1 hypothetical protein [Polaromonas sp.]
MAWRRFDVYSSGNPKFMLSGTLHATHGGLLLRICDKQFTVCVVVSHDLPTAAVRETLVAN